MSNPRDEATEDHPNIVGTDPDFAIGDEDPAAAERTQEHESEDDEDPGDDGIAVEDLP